MSSNKNISKSNTFTIFASKNKSHTIRAHYDNWTRLHFARQIFLWEVYIYDRLLSIIMFCCTSQYSYIWQTTINYHVLLHLSIFLYMTDYYQLSCFAAPLNIPIYDRLLSIIMFCCTSQYSYIWQTTINYHVLLHLSIFLYMTDYYQLSCFAAPLNIPIYDRLLSIIMFCCTSQYSYIWQTTINYHVLLHLSIFLYMTDYYQLSCFAAPLNIPIYDRLLSIIMFCCTSQYSYIWQTTINYHVLLHLSIFLYMTDYYQLSCFAAPLNIPIYDRLLSIIMFCCTSQYSYIWQTTINYHVLLHLSIFLYMTDYYQLSCFAAPLNIPIYDRLLSIIMFCCTSQYSYIWQTTINYHVLLHLSIFLYMTDYYQLSCFAAPLNIPIYDRLLSIIMFCCTSQYSYIWQTTINYHVLLHLSIFLYMT